MGFFEFFWHDNTHWYIVVLGRRKNQTLSWASFGKLHFLVGFKIPIFWQEIIFKSLAFELKFKNFQLFLPWHYIMIYCCMFEKNKLKIVLNKFWQTNVLRSGGFFWNSWEKRPLTPSAESLQSQFWERPNWSQFEALEEENILPHQGESLINLEHFQNEHWR